MIRSVGVCFNAATEKNSKPLRIRDKREEAHKDPKRQIDRVQYLFEQSLDAHGHGQFTM